jgi:UDP-N-acetylglucosamine 4-epimerase
VAALIQMSKYNEIQSVLRQTPKKWLVTGAGGFIGSNLLETLLKLDQHVVGLDNFVTGHQSNLDEVQRLVTPDQWARFSFIRGDICNLIDCQNAVSPMGKRVDYILHQAALGSVPRSIADPLAANRANVDGFLNMLVAARDAGVERFVYASSSSVYGDHLVLPKVEENIGRPLSPYAATKRINEIYADVFRRCYDLPVIGLRYFNVFGPRQDPNGAYAAVIPQWFSTILRGKPVYIYGDGETSRDFCYIANVVQANILAATICAAPVENVLNVACGGRITLKQLFVLIQQLVRKHCPMAEQHEVIFAAERRGDVKHSSADIRRARDIFGYEPTYTVGAGLEEACDWYLQNTDLREKWD